MSRSLGDAVLELRTDNTKLDAGMHDAESGLSRLREKLGIVHDAVELLEQAFEFFKGVGEIIGEWVQAAGQAELAMKRLEFAVSSSGTAGKTTMNEYVDLAHQLGEVTRQSHVAIETSETLLIQFGVSRANMERTTHAALDLSAALGIDLHSATMMLAKASEGNTTMLGRYGIKVDETIPKAQQFAAALTIIEQRFGGMAEVEGKTFLGMWDRVKNAFDEVYEALGRIIIETPELQAVLEYLIERFPALGRSIDDNSKALKAWLGEGITSAIDYARELVEWLDKIARSVGLRSLSSGLQEVDKSLGDMLAKVKGSGEKTYEIIKGIDGVWHGVAVSVAANPIVPGADTNPLKAAFAELPEFLSDVAMRAGQLFTEKLSGALNDWAKGYFVSFIDSTMNELRSIASIVFNGPVMQAQAEGSPKLPLSEYFTTYAPKVVGDFAAKATKDITAVKTNLTDAFAPGGVLWGAPPGSIHVASQERAMQLGTQTQFRDIYSAYKAGAPGAGYAFTPYGDASGGVGTMTKYWAGGFSGLVTQPQHFVAGESGAEWVEVTPGGKPGRGDGGGASSGGWEAAAAFMERTARATEQIASAWSNPGSGHRQALYQATASQYASGARGAPY